MSNTFGTNFRLTTFGESHGKAIGGIIDGCPSNFSLDFDKIQAELDRRKPGKSKLTSNRKEPDAVEFLSGIFEGKTLGTPIGFLIRNKDQKSKDYGNLKDIYRPSHADYTYMAKYGIRDYRGGGRASARETVSRVVGGAIARQFLSAQNIEIFAYVSQVGDIKLEQNYNERFESDNILNCPDKEISEKMLSKIEQVKKAGDSIGGTINCVIKNIPAGLGEPVFNKFHAELSKAILGINACKGFEIGSGFQAASMLSSQHNDIFYFENNKIRTKTNNSGGVQGGITNGEDVYFKAVFKPVPTIMQEQETITTLNKSIAYKAKGRHDPCVLPRALPIVEAMAAMVSLDFLLLK